VDRNGFTPLTPETVIDSPLCFDEPTSPCPLTHSLWDLHVELQEDLVPFTKTHVDLHKSTRGTHQRHNFVPKKSLEYVLDKLKGKVYVIPNPGKDVVDKNEIKTKKQGKHKTQAQLNQVITRNSVLEKENDDLRACIRSNSHRANKRFKRLGNVIIKNSTSFNAIVNSDLSDVSLSNL
jgi:hypothetical protein